MRTSVVRLCYNDPYRPPHDERSPPTSTRVEAVLRDILLPMVAALLISAPALADRHAADSGPAVLDTEPPALAITAPAGGELVYGNETHTLIWSLQEPHHASGVKQSDP